MQSNISDDAVINDTKISPIDIILYKLHDEAEQKWLQTKSYTENEGLKSECDIEVKNELFDQNDHHGEEFAGQSSRVTLTFKNEETREEDVVFQERGEISEITQENYSEMSETNRIPHVTVCENGNSSPILKYPIEVKNEYVERNVFEFRSPHKDNLLQEITKMDKDSGENKPSESVIKRNTKLAFRGSQKLSKSKGHSKSRKKESKKIKTPIEQTCVVQSKIEKETTKSNNHLMRRRKYNMQAKHQCTHCPLSFSSRYIFLKHVNLHQSKLIKEMKHIKAQNSLESDVGAIGTLTCEKCGRKFVTQGNLIQHLMWHKRQFLELNDSERDITLGISEKEMSRVKTHERPLLEPTIEDNKRCKNVAKQAYLSEDSSSNDSTDKKSKKTKQCKICRTTVSIIRFKHHMLTHSSDLSDRPFICSFCEKRYIERSDLNQHMKRSHSGPNFLCDLCDKTFQTKFGRGIHMRKVHGESCEQEGAKEETGIQAKKQTGVHCSICDIEFYGEYNLKRHMMSHNNIRPFKCRECNKSFKCKYILDKHFVRAHTKEKSFVCVLCSGKFKTQTNLLAHCKRMHAENSIYNEFPHPCQKCKLHFKTKDDLEKHLALPFYECDICNKHYTKSSTLANHKKMKHVGGKFCAELEPQFSCPICDKKFMYKKSVQRHVDSIHKEPQFSCSICEKKFAHKNSLKRHLEICKGS